MYRKLISYGTYKISYILKQSCMSFILTLLSLKAEVFEWWLVWLFCKKGEKVTLWVTSIMIPFQEDVSDFLIFWFHRHMWGTKQKWLNRLTFWDSHLASAAKPFELSNELHFPPGFFKKTNDLAFLVSPSLLPTREDQNIKKSETSSFKGICNW